MSADRRPDPDPVPIPLPAFPRNPCRPGPLRHDQPEATLAAPPLERCHHRARPEPRGNAPDALPVLLQASFRFARIRVLLNYRNTSRRSPVTDRPRLHPHTVPVLATECPPDPEEPLVPRNMRNRRIIRVHVHRAIGVFRDDRRLCLLNGRARLHLALRRELRAPGNRHPRSNASLQVPRHPRVESHVLRINRTRTRRQLQMQPSRIRARHFVAGVLFGFMRKQRITVAAPVPPGKPGPVRGSSWPPTGCVGRPCSSSSTQTSLASAFRVGTAPRRCRAGLCQSAFRGNSGFPSRFREGSLRRPSRQPRAAPIGFARQPEARRTGIPNSSHTRRLVSATCPIRGCGRAGAACLAYA